jgi:ABC-type phosphate transport system substrate-binding protein
MISRKEIAKMRSFRVFLSVLFVVSVLGFTACATEMVNKDDPDAATAKKKDEQTVKSKASGSNQVYDMPGN